MITIDAKIKYQKEQVEQAQAAMRDAQEARRKAVLAASDAEHAFLAAQDKLIALLHEKQA